MIINQFHSTLLLMFLFIGCSSTYKGDGPHFTSIANNIEKIGIISSDLKVFEISGGGIPEYRFDWSITAKRNLAMSFSNQLNKKGFQPTLIENNESNYDFDTLFSYVNLVASTIQKHLYGENCFLPEIDSFDYSIGSIGDLCRDLNIDALLFIFGAEENFSDLRKEILKKAASAKTAKSAIFGFLSGLATGYYSIKSYTVPDERTSIGVLIADRTGKIVWYKNYNRADDANLRNNFDTDKIVKTVIREFNYRK